MFNQDDVSYINRVVEPVEATEQADPAVLYTALYTDDSNQPQALMTKKMDLLLSGMKVTDH